MINVKSMLSLFRAAACVGLAVGLLFVVAAAQGQTTRYVDQGASSERGPARPTASFGRIQQAIEASNDGDEVVVHDGTYVGGFDFRGKRITLRSANGPDKCVISGGGVVLRNGETTETRIEGFTITGGRAAASSRGGDPWGGAMLIYRASPTVADCVFEDNSAEWDGGAIAIFRGSPAIINCTFINNTAGNDGGGICNRDGSPTITDCVFADNSADSDGGGVYTDSYFEPADVTLTDCAFFGNTVNGAYGYGGGLWSGGNTTLVNCTFSGNTAFASGGISSFWDSTILAGCTISANSATDFVGGLYADGFSSDLTVVNSILWGNSDAGGTDELAQVYAADGTLTIDSSCIEGLTGELGGWGNIGDDPRFADADGPDGMVGTDDDDLHLSADSPCINAGDDAAPIVPEFDFEGDPRVQMCRIDMGIDETDLFVDCQSNGLSDACEIAAGSSLDCTGNGIPDECEPDCNSNGVADSCDIAADTSRDCNSNDEPDECEPDCNTNGAPDDCDLVFSTSQDCNTNGTPDECEPGTVEPCVRYVDAAAIGAADGTSWTNAYADLQDALADAASNGAVSQVWVATGTYRPDRGTGSQEAGFVLVSGVAIYGGFAGTEIRLNQRDPETYETTLSGDLDGDDLPGFVNYDDNSYHVVIGSDADDTATLDGFTISGGNAVCSDPEPCGGGMYNDGSSPAVFQCVFKENRGIAMHNSSVGSPTVVGCTFVANDGGGMINDGGAWPYVSDCSFESNVGSGMICHRESNPVVTGCTFSGNAADRGGGMALYECRPMIVDCAFIQNSAFGAYIAGGGMYVEGARPQLFNCTFSENIAESRGGGIYNVGGLRLTDCTLTGNSAVDQGGGMYNGQGYGPDGRFTLTRCTVSNNSAPDGAGIFSDGGTTATGCTFSGNVAAGDGGGMYDAGYPTLTNCTFRGNSAENGGGVYVFYGYQLIGCGFGDNSATAYGGGVYTASYGGRYPHLLTNCTFHENTAGVAGGGCYRLGDEELALTNCILWGNSDAGGADEFAQLYVEDSANLEINYCCIQGLSSYDGGIGSTDANPLFAFADDFHLMPTSPCIDAGTSGVPNTPFWEDWEWLWVLPPTDLDGNPRVIDGGWDVRAIVDMGAYEYQADCNDNGVHDRDDIAAGTSDDCNTNGFADECEPDCNSNGVPDGCDLLGGHDCCGTAHGPGCSNPAIRDCVCAIDPYCCEVDWDRLCVEETADEGCFNCQVDNDCNTNSIPDECDISTGTSADANTNGIPDECEGCPYIYDLDGSCFVDATDLGLFAPCWLLSDGEAGWNENECADKDFDCSGTVDAIDLGLFAGAWLKTSDEFDPAAYPECRPCGAAGIICPWLE